MNFVLDRGNTRTKYGVFDRGDLIESGVVENLDGLVARYGAPFVFDPRQHAAPLKNTYPTLGADRIAAAVGAMDKYPDRELLVVDFGTAITIDRITREGSFAGGVISPGVGMRFAALHEKTKSLPLCTAAQPAETATHEAIQNGVLQGIAYEIEGHIRDAGERTVIIFTGGDAKLFAKRIKSAIFAECNLVLQGLNRILEYNADK